MFQPPRSWHTRRVSLPPASVRSIRGGRGTVLALLMISACSTGTSDAERFCGEIAADPTAVVAPPLGTEEEFESALAHYRMLAELAPVAIEQEWRALVVNLETVATVVPSDDDSLRRAVAQAYATERSAVEVQRWLLANCSIDLGPVGTVVPHDPVVPAVDWPDEGDDGVDTTDAPDQRDRTNDPNG